MSKKPKRKKSHRNKFIKDMVRALAVVAAAFAVYFYNDSIKEFLGGGRTVKEEASEPDTTVEFIDVGQGDSTLVCSDGEYMLIDTGDRDSGNMLINYLEDSGVGKISYLILTHPHADHIGEAAEIVEKFEIGTIIAPELPEDKIPTTAIYEDLLDAMEEKELSFHAAADEQFSLGTCDVYTYAPQEDYSNLNNYSVIIKIVHGGNSFLVTGDCETTEESEFLSRGCDLSADVLKAGHHGSDTSNSSEWLQAVSPDYAVISCGLDNSYGHPDDDTLARIKKYASYVYITAEDGTVKFESDGSGLNVVLENAEDG